MEALNKILDALINKFHTIIGSVWMAALLIYRWKTGNDVGPGMANCTYAFFGFLLGHAYTYQVHPDRPDQNQQ